MKTGHAMRTCLMLLIVVLSLQCALAERPNRIFTEMPPYPKNPDDYLNKWDVFCLQASPGEEGDFLSVPNRYNQPYELDVAVDLSLEDPFSPVNGRQIARDGLGNWFVLVGRGTKLFLATGHGPRLVGGDLTVMELVGDQAKGAVLAGPTALPTVPGEILGASMVVDGKNRLHIVWCGPKGLWYIKSNREDGNVEVLRQKESWTEPRLVAEGRCRPGDIMLDTAGNVSVCYSVEDTVYYLSLADEKVETVAGVGAGLPVLAGMALDGGPERSPIVSRQCQGAVMDQSADGTIHLAFQRDFEVWATQRTPDGQWLPAQRVAYDALYPSILVTGGKPLICFQTTHQRPSAGDRNMVLGSENYLADRLYKAANVSFATPTATGWRVGCVAEAEELIVHRRGIWDQMNNGRLIPMQEVMGRPTLFRDRHGVAWALWQNTTRRWAYSARWMGDGFGQVQECRGPFNAPGLPALAEKFVPATASDVGVLFVSGPRVIFDRLVIPTLSASDQREVMFLDSLEVGQTEGVEFVLNQMTKHPSNPVLAPGPPGSKDDYGIIAASVAKHGDTYVATYDYANWKDKSPWDFSGRGLAISDDGAHWQKVDELPADLPSRDPPYPDEEAARASRMPAYIENPDQSDPQKKYMRTAHMGEVGWAAGSYQVQFSPDGKQWTDGVEVSVLNALREGGMPNLWDTLDVPERRIKIYSRAYTVNARSCGMMWTSDLIHWNGVEQFLDVDDPYGTPPVTTPHDRPVEEAYTVRGQIFLDACAGKGEDEIYSAEVQIVEGLYFCDYRPVGPHHERDFGYAIAVSRDGFNFTRVKNGSRTLAPGPPGAWDSGLVFQVHPMRDGDNLMVYYRGCADGACLKPQMIGLATIRVNGWTYYTPQSGQDRGTVTTIPIQASEGENKYLTVNIEGVSGKTGAFAVEVLDAETLKPLEGFSLADCQTPTKDGLAVPVTWPGRKPRPSEPVTWSGSDTLPAGREFRLRFHLNAPGVRLYSFGFQGENPTSR